MRWKFGTTDSRFIDESEGQALWRRYRNWQYLISVALLALAGALSTGQSWLASVDLRFYESLQTLLPAPVSDNIVTIQVDDSSLLRIGRWPWPRQLHAQMIDLLTSARASTIVFAISFQQPDEDRPASDIGLLKAMDRSRKVCVPSSAPDPVDETTESVSTFGSKVLGLSACHGHVEVFMEPDGVQRGLTLPGSEAPSAPAPLAFKVVRRILGEPAISTPQVSGYQRLWLARGYRSFSFASVLNQEVDATLFRDKVVVIGVSATGVANLFSKTGHPAGRTTAAEALAADIDAVWHERYIRTVPTTAQIIFTVMIVLLMMALLPQLSVGLGLTVTIGLTLILLLASALLFHFQSTWWPPTASVTALLACYPLWSWARMKNTERFLEAELSQLSELGAPSFLPSRSTHFDRELAKMEEIAEIRHQLDQARIQREEVLSFLSHDMKSPFVSIITFLNSMESAPEARGLEDSLRKLRNSAERGLNLTLGFQALIRAQHVDRVEFEQIDLLMLIDEIVDEIWERAQERNMTVILFPDFEPGLLVWGDEAQLRRLFANLLDNALRYGDEGEPISISWWLNFPKVKVAVKSKGLPIPDDEAAQLFNKHARGERAHERSQDGSGLGLAICKSIAEAHAGSIALQRPEPGVAIFEVTFNVTG